MLLLMDELVGESITCCRVLCAAQGQAYINMWINTLSLMYAVYWVSIPIHAVVAVVAICGSSSLWIWVNDLNSDLSMQQKLCSPEFRVQTGWFRLGHACCMPCMPCRWKHSFGPRVPTI